METQTILIKKHSPGLERFDELLNRIRKSTRTNENLFPSIHAPSTYQHHHQKETEEIKNNEVVVKLSSSTIIPTHNTEEPPIEHQNKKLDWASLVEAARDSDDQEDQLPDLTEWTNPSDIKIPSRDNDVVLDVQSRSEIQASPPLSLLDKLVKIQLGATTPAGTNDDKIQNISEPPESNKPTPITTEPSNSSGRRKKNSFLLSPSTSRLLNQNQKQSIARLIIPAPSLPPTTTTSTTTPSITSSNQARLSPPSATTPTTHHLGHTLVSPSYISPLPLPSSSSSSDHFHAPIEQHTKPKSKPKSKTKIREKTKENFNKEPLHQQRQRQKSIIDPDNGLVDSHDTYQDRNNRKIDHRYRASIQTITSKEEHRHNRSLTNLEEEQDQSHKSKIGEIEKVKPKKNKKKPKQMRGSEADSDPHSKSIPRPPSSSSTTFQTHIHSPTPTNPPPTNPTPTDPTTTTNHPRKSSITSPTSLNSGAVRRGRGAMNLFDKLTGGTLLNSSSSSTTITTAPLK
ncbi:hypothetical protein MJO28_015764 [Puccinia striiformis f. sp. tritici]|uniref:Uncharacterized protein n=1 Tax=Puccinia striiformis f. sp. tritici TaxID=168172 RepID=A0ACC0DPL2_9BASI|nr:hypothetical protein Pst134EB_029922 [Puccinia striiformis f. sp. tritici]KAI7936865.1 hypothetical protein MJO28_015764 [Puccinia striiformis f. sp. tritici]KAI9623180.1 hypothetical protein H4Q26_014676 [Puccinia striiformis f. sp. tritici PST-130]